MKSWIKIFAIFGVLIASPELMAKSPKRKLHTAPIVKSASSSFQQTFQTIIQKDPYWRVLKKRFPEKFAILQNEIIEELNQFFHENPLESRTLSPEQYVGLALDKVYQNPKIIQIIQDVYAQSAQSDDSSIIKISEARLHVMNRLLAHNDSACYLWLNQQLDSESFAAAFYEIRLSQNAIAEGLNHYNPKRPKPDEKQAQASIQNAFESIVKQHANSMLPLFNNNENNNLAPNEQRQLCILERDVLTHLLSHKDVNALRHILMTQ